MLADEPTAALDSLSGRAVMELLRKLAHERGRAVVMVTHDNRILEFADRLVHIEDGRILRNATARHAPPAGSEPVGVVPIFAAPSQPAVSTI